MARPPAPVYRLRRAAPPAAAVPALDEAQRAVVEHAGGPLLVLAGPGTGKTTTLVEAVAARVAAGADPAQLLVLTFSRKAAAELRERIGRRLGRTTAGPVAATFHSFCFSLLAAEGPAPRLLSGAEQEVAVRELLDGSLDEPLARIDWPSAIAAAIGTRGLAEEVRGVLARVAERDIDLLDAAAADPARAAQWRALAGFAEVYLDVLDARGLLDHAELVRRAVLLAERPDRRARLREGFRAVFVDEYQDTDAAQVRLLRALAGDGRDLIVFGDPDQSIYAFRGAQVRELLDFADRFPDAAGRPAPTVALRTSRRSGPELLAAARQVARRLPLAGLDAEAARTHRALSAAGPTAAEDPVAVLTFPGEGAELEYVADVLRRAHLEDGLAWSDMAVLVRSGTRSVPAVRRVLGGAGVPFVVGSDEVPLRAEPAVALLCTAAAAAADPTTVTPLVARTLLLSPLGGVEPMALRRLGRALRARDRARDEASLTPAEVALRDVLLNPDRLGGIEDLAVAPTRALADLLAGAGALCAAGAPAEDVLWRLWSGTDWPNRLARAAIGSGAAAERADRDLDAVCALFALAGRAAERPGGGGVAGLVAHINAQQIPGDPPIGGDGTRDAVRVMTAHRSKGLEWPLVAVIGVQEGVWPDLRRRGSFLGADTLGAHGPEPAATHTELLAEERRLFYVAVTRARQRLLVTAVAAPDEAGDRPSRFLRELGVEPVPIAGRVRRPLSAGSLAADLRATLIDPTSSPDLRATAAARLAALAALRTPEGRALVPAADPAHWWGMSDPTAAAAPLRDPEAPVDLSGSAVDGLNGCPLQWFLRREVRAEDAPTAALGFGNVLHALAEEVGRGAAADLPTLMARLDTVWAELSFDALWQSRDQREAARDALARFLQWHLGRPDRKLLGVEVPFELSLPVEGDRVRLRGRLDRVETDPHGQVWVVDLKTGKTPPTKEEMARHPQLGVYQAVVAAGGLAELPGAGDACGGAEIVMLRQEAGKSGLPKVHGQPSPASSDDPQWVAQMLSRAAARVRSEAFTPVPSEDCDRCPYRRCCPAQPEGAQVVS